MSRVATDPMNGYIYQRYYSIYKFCENHEDYEYFLEEGNEDIDMIKNNKNKTVIQIKYHRTDVKESLTKDSGLFKVIKSDENIKDNDIIDIIEYISYISTGETYNEHVLKAFNLAKYINLGKYTLLLLTKLKKNSSEKTDVDINTELLLNDNELEKIFNIDKDVLNHQQAKFFLDINFCNKYFSKFILNNGLSPDKLKEIINKKLYNMYPNFIGNESDGFHKIKIKLLFNEIFNLFNENMFSHPEKNDKTKRLLKSSAIKNKLDDIINTFNITNLTKELIRSYDKQIKNNNLSNIYKGKLINELNEIICTDEEIEFVQYLCDLINTNNKMNKSNNEKNNETNKLNNQINKSNNLNNQKNNLNNEINNETNKLDFNNIKEIIIDRIWRSNKFNTYTTYLERKQFITTVNSCIICNPDASKFNFPTTKIVNLFKNNIKTNNIINNEQQKNYNVINKEQKVIKQVKKLINIKTKLKK
jgi:hypothetical protein